MEDQFKTPEQKNPGLDQKSEEKKKTKSKVIYFRK
jgi:hypothetical protein